MERVRRAEAAILTAFLTKKRYPQKTYSEKVRHTDPTAGI